MVHRILAVIILLSSISCSSTLEKDDYIKWIHDYKNGLHAQSSLGDFIFDLQYQPLQYFELINSSENSIQSDSSMQYYALIIDVQHPGVNIIEYNIQNVENKQRRLYYFSYQFQQDMYLEENGEKYDCVLYHFESQPDLKKGKTFLLGFENNNPTSTEATLVIDSEIFSALPIRIKILKDNIPSLTL